MGVLLKNLKIVPLKLEDIMRMKVKQGEFVCILFRRSGPNAWHLQGVFVDSEGISGEELACASAIDNTYFIVKTPINVLLPEKVIDHVIGYCPKPDVGRIE